MTTLYSYSDASAPTMNNAAGGLIGVLDACLVNGYGAKGAAGWSKVYSGTNKAAYQAPSGNQFFLRVDDSAADYARVVGYETMSDIDTGTNAFPTNTQVSGGLYWHKSSSASNVDWWIVANTTAFAFMFRRDTTTTYGHPHVFGDIEETFLDSDSYDTVIIGSESSSISLSAADQIRVTSASTLTGHYMPRAQDGSGTSIAAGKGPLTIWDGATYSGIGNMLYPNPSDFGLFWSKLVIFTGSTYARGYVPLLRSPWFQGATHGDAMSDTIGNSVIFLKTYNNGFFGLEY